MSAEARTAAAALKSAIDRHLTACEARTGENDPAVQAAYEDLRAAAEAYDDAAALLTDAGYTSDPADSSVENSGLFRSDAWTVSVSVLPWEQGAVAVQYSVLSAEVF